jgi:hypothetical protein
MSGPDEHGPEPDGQAGDKLPGPGTGRATGSGRPRSDGQDAPTGAEPAADAGDASSARAEDAPGGGVEDVRGRRAEHGRGGGAKHVRGGRAEHASREAEHSRGGAGSGQGRRGEHAREPRGEHARGPDLVGEHAGGGTPDGRSFLRRAFAATQGHNVRHRPQLGGMSTSLLNNLLTEHLDRGYAEVAARKANTPAAERKTRTTEALLATGLLLVGFVLAASYRNTRQEAPASERTRQGLVREVESRTATSDTLRRHADTLGRLLVRERDATLTASETGDRVSKQVRDLEGAAALVPVRGPGIVVALGGGLRPPP